MLKFTDYVKINPSQKLLSMDSREKVKFIDSAMESSEGRMGGLVVTYDLSHSGRRINNRVYSPAGQLAGVDSLMLPYPKPILLNHDQSVDPIGRFIGGEWQDLTNLNYQHFENVGQISELRGAFDTYDFEKVYGLMKRNNLLTNANYSGLGRIRVQANIRDPKAIEKFLDGRYMTFSAGSTTDKHVCSICYSDWAQGDFCEHRHGKIYDNEICVFMTGSFQILEGSVVNTPADDLSQIISMEYYNDNNELQNLNFDTKMDPSTFYLSDSFFNLINDSEIKMEKIEESSVEKVETEVVVAKDSDTETTVEEVVAETVTDEQTEEVEAKVVITDAIKEAIEEAIETQHETAIADVDGDINVLVDEVALDWYLLDCALTIELEDKTLSAEQRKELPDSAFCGPDRSFPVNDCAHVTAARRLVSRAKLSDAQKAKVLACVNAKANEMKCDMEEQKDTQELNNLKQEIIDLKNNLEKEMNDLKKLLQDKLDRLVLEEVEQADNSKEIENELVEEKVVLKEIENPSVGTSDNSSPTDSMNLDSLGTFEKKAVQQYAEILNQDGEAAANAFWEFKSQYLNKGFDPKKFIN